ncbi:MAG TPA: PAS domain-containing protein, partial [Chloroflexota bacterium]|nr:PAS domain-containing protein [Chloroflexota bacterium]
MDETTGAAAASLTGGGAKRASEGQAYDAQPPLRDVLDTLASFVALLSMEGTVLEANRPALDIASLRSQDVLGQPFAETYWWSHDEEVQARLREALTRAAAGEPSRYHA